MTLLKVVRFLVQTMTSKSPFEINWPLTSNFKYLNISSNSSCLLRIYEVYQQVCQIIICKLMIPQQISTKIYGIVPYCELIFSSTQEKYFGHVENAILLAHRRAQDYTIQARTKDFAYKSYGELFFIIDSIL